MRDSAYDKTSAGQRRDAIDKHAHGAAAKAA
jgi:hypothetical protein